MYTCNACEKPAKKISLISHDEKIYFGDIKWFEGVLSVSKDYFENRDDKIIFGCNEKHLHKCIVRYLMIEKLKEEIK